MHDLELARLIHADREREIERNLRARAVRIALADRDANEFVPSLGNPSVRSAEALPIAALRRAV